jgi:predicted transcriptional regulator of viral defense system
MNASATSILKSLRQNRLRVFTTSDVATLARISRSAASHLLRRLAQKGALQLLKQGVWIYSLSEEIHPYEAVPHMVRRWPCYVSLYSALSEYGLIAEVPQIIYAVTADRVHRYQTLLGTYHFHHLPSHLFWGYQLRRFGQGEALIAEPEKAFLDLAYLSLVPRSQLKFPPKRGKHWQLDEKKIIRYARRFKCPKLEEFLFFSLFQ